MLTINWKSVMSKHICLFRALVRSNCFRVVISVVLFSRFVIAKPDGFLCDIGMFCFLSSFFSNFLLILLRLKRFHVLLHQFWISNDLFSSSDFIKTETEMCCKRMSHAWIETRIIDNKIMLDYVHFMHECILRYRMTIFIDFSSVPPSKHVIIIIARCYCLCHCHSQFNCITYMRFDWCAFESFLYHNEFPRVKSPTPCC